MADYFFIVNETEILVSGDQAEPASNGFQSITETVVRASYCCKVLTLVAICGLALLPHPLLVGQCKEASKACV